MCESRVQLNTVIITTISQLAGAGANCAVMRSERKLKFLSFVVSCKLHLLEESESKFSRYGFPEFRSVSTKNKLHSLRMCKLELFMASRNQWNGLIMECNDMQMSQLFSSKQK